MRDRKQLIGSIMFAFRAYFLNQAGAAVQSRYFYCRSPSPSPDVTKVQYPSRSNLINFFLLTKPARLVAADFFSLNDQPVLTNQNSEV